MGTEPTGYTDMHIQTDKTFIYIIYVYLRGREGHTCLGSQEEIKVPETVLVLSFYCVGSGKRTEVIRLGGQ